MGQSRRSPFTAGVLLLAALVAGCGSGAVASSSSSARPPTTAVISATETEAPAIAAATSAPASATSGTSAAGVVRVASCPVPAADYAGTPFKPQAAPATISLPASVTLPAGAQVFGTTFRPGATPYLVGPQSATCQGAWASADGGEFMTVTRAAQPAGRVIMVASAGGIGPATDLACPYIPAVRTVDEVFRQTRNPAWCDHPSAEVVRQIPTGTAHLYAAVVLVPARVKDPGIQGSGGPDQTVALYAAVVAQGGADGQMIACTLAPAQAGICAASLRYFLTTQTLISTRMSAANLSQMQQVLSSFLATHSIG